MSHKAICDVCEQEIELGFGEKVVRMLKPRGYSKTRMGTLLSFSRLDVCNKCWTEFGMLVRAKERRG